MTVEIVLALSILAAVVIVLATGLLRTDVVALLVLVLVALLGLLPAEQALAGFSNQAVLAVGGMFVISAGLSRTGVAGILGQWMLRLAGKGEVQVMVVVTLVSGLLSGVMNNVGVVAMMLPVVVTIARKTGLPPSKLLIPMAVGAQLGGWTTLVGTSSLLLASSVLRDAGFAPLTLLSVTPVGLVLLAGGTTLVAFAAPRILPTRTPREQPGAVDRSGIREDVSFDERLFFLVIPTPSLLDGRTLAESLIDSALGVHVLAIQRGGRTYRAPGPEMVLRSGDRILVQGRPDFVLELRGRRHLATDDETVSPEWLESAEVGLARGVVAPSSRFVGKSAADLDLRAREGILILSLRRGEEFHKRTHFVDTPMAEGDELLLQGPRDALERLSRTSDVESFEPMKAATAVRDFELENRLWALRVTSDSLLSGRALGTTRLGDSVGFFVLAVGRDGEDGRKIHLLPGRDLVFQEGDHLLMKARPQDMAVLRGLQRMEVDLESPVNSKLLEGGDAGFVEVVVAPRSSLVGRTLRQVNFRSRFGMHVVAIVREGGVVRSNLRDQTLRLGDALLLYGLRRHERALAREPDLILLHSPEVETPQQLHLAPLSVVVAAVALLPVLFGWIPVPVGVLAGAALMVVTRCLTPEEAYRAVEWPTVVLIAGMLSLGSALGESGAMDLFGNLLIGAVGEFGPYALLTSIVLLCALSGQLIPGTAVVVLMAPMAVAAATFLGYSPYPFAIAVAIASSSLASPLSHPAHALVMAPAGYRVVDYLRLGIPMTILILALTILTTPIFYPF